MDWPHGQRGSLKHISDTLFDFFCSLEIIYLSIHAESANEKEGIKDVVIQKMMKDKDVLFCSLMVAVNWEVGESDALMRLMSEQWVTLRGFSYVSAFVEKYKHWKKKSKGLRKKLNATVNDEKKTSATALDEKKGEWSYYCCKATCQVNWPYGIS